MKHFLVAILSLGLTNYGMAAQKKPKAVSKETKAAAVSTKNPVQKVEEVQQRAPAAADPRSTHPVSRNEPSVVVTGTDFISAEEVEIQKNIKLRLLSGSRDEEPLRVQAQLTAVVTSETSDVVTEAEEEPED